MRSGEGRPARPAASTSTVEVELAALDALALAEGVAQQRRDLRRRRLPRRSRRRAPRRARAARRAAEGAVSGRRMAGLCKATCAGHGRGTVASAGCSGGRLSPWSWRSCGRFPAPPGRPPTAPCSSWIRAAWCTPSTTRSCPRPSARRRVIRAPAPARRERLTRGPGVTGSASARGAATVLSELRRLRGAGLLDAEQSADYDRQWRRARRALKTLKGGRKRDLAGVLERGQPDGRRRPGHRIARARPAADRAAQRRLVAERAAALPTASACASPAAG